MQLFTTNNKTIHEIYRMYEEESLIVDESYQRRSVWGEKDKIRLIETVLLNLVIPELFFWRAETNPETGKTITHIVDGQQRIKAITAFIHNEVKLKPQYLLDNITKEKFSNKLFQDFTAEEKTQFWNYNLMIIEFNQEASREQIVKIFRRLNLTDYNLNDQEKRNSLSGDFAVLARDISEFKIWTKYSLFNVADVKRMKDVEFCANLIILFKKGIVDQTDQTILNQAYEDYQTGYDDADMDMEKISDAINALESFFISEKIIKFLKRKAQLYTLFCILFYMNRENIHVENEHRTRLEEFVTLYSKFSNDLDLEGRLSDAEKGVFDILKKYKLASSEGLNKHTNRMIRQNAMKDFLFCSNSNQLAAAKTLLEKMDDAGVVEVEEPEEEEDFELQT